MPAAHQCGHGSRLGKAEPGKRVQGLRIILDPGEHQVAGAGKARGLLEERAIMLLYRSKMDE